MLLADITTLGPAPATVDQTVDDLEHTSGAIGAFVHILGGAIKDFTRLHTSTPSYPQLSLLK